MNKILFSALLVLCMAACKKEDVAEPPATKITEPTVEEQIIGLWYSTGTVTNIYHNGVFFNTAKEPDEEVTFQFYTDNTFIAKAPGYPDVNGTWGYDKINGNFIFEMTPFRIDTLTDSTFVFVNSSDKTINNTVVTKEVIVSLKK